MGEHSRGLAEAKVSAPSEKVWREILDHFRQAVPSCPAGHLPDLRLELGERLWRDAPLAPVIRDAEPQEFTLLRWRHRAFRLVDLQLQLVGQKPAHRSHDPLPGAATANIDVAVVGPRVRALRGPRTGSAAEAETPAGQFLVEIVEHQIAQEGRERTTLRGALIHRTDQAVLHHPGLEKGTDEFEHPLIRHPRGDPRHQAVVIDSVEKFFEIKIDHDAVALGDVSLCLGHRLVGGSPRSEAVAVLGECWVPALLENLQHGLLDQPVDDARDAELSDPAIRLRDFDPLDRLRLVGSREQLRPDVWPVLTQVGLGALDGHSIDARATLVAANSFPRSYEISSVAHLLHQLFCAGWAFGCGLRHGWFGPLVSAARGFTPAFWDQGQRVLDLLPRSTHELPVLLAALDRSGLRSSFPA